MVVLEAGLEAAHSWAATAAEATHEVTDPDSEQQTAQHVWSPSSKKATNVQVCSVLSRNQRHCTGSARVARALPVIELKAAWNALIEVRLVSRQGLCPIRNGCFAA
jgi:hypothetical protein